MCVRVCLAPCTLLRVIVPRAGAVCGGGGRVRCVRRQRAIIDRTPRPAAMTTTTTKVVAVHLSNDDVNYLHVYNYHHQF